jgi:two-component system nitrate/nitrite response regulator NarL
MRKTVLIADDHALVLHGLASLIERDPGFKVISLNSDGVEALAGIKEHKPDLALLDVNMPGLDGTQVLAALDGDPVRTRIVLLTAAATDAQLYDAVLKGAAGIVIKDAAVETLMTCLATVAEGGQWLPQELLDVVVSREKSRRDKWLQLSANLTAREMEIVRMTLQRHSTKDISFLLQISHGTCKVHLNNIFRKLDVSSRQELMSLASGQL